MHSTNSATNKAVIAYVPALHAGYISFFKKHNPAKVFVLGKSFIDAFPRLNRDLRALAPEEAVLGLQALGFTAEVLEITDVAKINSYGQIVLPDEDVSRDFGEKYITHTTPLLENVFLRWDGIAPDRQKEVSPDRVTSTDKLDREFMKQAFVESEKSADWWRQIGAVLVKEDETVLGGHIRYFPSDLALDIFGTPRSNFDFGQRPDVYISMHAEADVVAQAAKEGVALAGASIYSSTFPCINCAFLLARSGIAKLYYAKGYSNLDSEEVLRSAGIEIIFVKP